MRNVRLLSLFIVGIFFCFSGEMIAGVVTTRVTGAANWGTVSTWIQNRTGTITASTVSTTVTGVGTAFDTELSPGDVLVLQTAPGTVIGTVASILNATQLTLTANAGANAAAQAYGREAVPTSSDDVVIGNTALVGAAVTVTLDVASATVNSLSFTSMALANTLTHSGVNVLTVSNNVTVNQPTAAVTISWNINAGSATVNGDVLIGGSNITASRVSQIAVTTGALSVGGSLTYASNTNSVNEVVSVTTGTISLNNVSTLSSGTLSMTGAGTINFNGGLSYGGANNPVMSTTAGSNLNIGGNLSAVTNALTFNAGSNVTFTNTSTITPTSAITFGNVLINPSVTVTLGGNIVVAGNWTNNGGSLNGGANTVTFSGTAKTIGGTASTSFPGMSMSAGATYTLNTDISSTSLTFAASSAASSLTHAASVTLTVNGNVTVNQPTAGVTTAWNINAGFGVVNGNVSIGGIDLTPARSAQIAVTTGSLTVSGSVTYAANASAATEVISVTTGTISLANALTLSSGTLSMTGAGTINFNGGLSYGGANNPVMSTAAGSNLNIGGNLSAVTNVLTFNAGSNVTFTNTSTVTPTSAITFGNVLINTGVTVTLGGNIVVAGNWTNNGGSLSGGANTVTFSGAAKTIGGTASTSFPGMLLSTGATYTLNTDISSTSLTFAASSAASSLTHAASVTLTVNGNVTVNQPTASVTTSWNINAGFGLVNGNISIGGANTISSRIAQIAVTTGSLTVSGSVTYAANASAATEVISVTTGTISLANALTLSSGTLSMTGAGTINFNGGLAYGGVNNPVMLTASGSNLNIGGNLSAVTNALTFNAGSNVTFTNISTVTPTSAITFGNVLINTGVTVTLGGNIVVAGNWTNNGGSLSGGANTVTFSGAAKTIGGTAGTDFPIVAIASSGSSTINTNGSCTGLIFAASSGASSLTHAAGIVLTVNGNVTINQPTASVITSWNINTGSAAVNGDILIGGANTTSSRVAQIAVTTGSLTVTGSVTYTPNASAATEVISVTTGIISLNNLLTLSSGTLTMTGAGTINFNGGFSYGGANNPIMSTASGSNLNIGGNLSAGTTALAFNAGSNVTFTNTSMITPSSAITFGNVQINPGVNITLSGNVTVAGNWTNNGGSLSGGVNTLTFSGAAKTIGGSAGTDFPIVAIASGGSFTINTNGSCTGLIFAASSGASSLTHGAGIVLTVNGNVTINQPTASVITSWNINTGSAAVNGDILIGGANTTSSRVAQIAVTTGSLTITGTVTYASNASAATEVVSVTTGSISFANALTLSSGTLSMTGTGTINFNGGLSYGGANNPVMSTASGSNLNIGGDISSVTTALTFNTGSNATFTNTSTITPASAMTFGNVQTNPGVNVTFGGSISVSGNFTIQLKSLFNPASFGLTLKGNLITNGTFVPSSSTVTLNGSSSQTISGLMAPIFNNLTINNSSPSGVTLAEDADVNGTFTLTSGAFAIGANTLSLNGAITKTGGNLVGGSSSNVIIGGSGSSTSLPAVSLSNLILNRASGISLGGNVTVNGTLSLTDGNFSIGSNTLTLNGGISVSNGSLTGSSTSNITIGNAIFGITLPAVTLNNLTLNRSAGANLTGNATINGTLTFSAGTITTGVSKVIISPTGSIVRASGHVVGNLQKNIATGTNILRLFEIGDANSYTPAEITFGNVTSSGNLLSSITIGDHPNISGSGIIPSKSVNRYWTLSNDSTTFDSYNGKFNFVSGDIDAGANTNNFIVQKFDSPAWSTPAIGTRTPTNIQATGMTSFSDFAVGEVVSYAITASAGTGGSISPSGIVSVLHGSTKKFTFTPNTGYYVSDLLVDGIHSDSMASYTFVNITAGHTINVTFAIDLFTITATAGTHGVITPSGAVVVQYGTGKQFTLTPDFGYHVDSLIVDGVKIDSTASYTFISVQANHTINVKYAINAYIITATAGLHGSISPSGSVGVNSGDTRAFTFTPASGYHVDSMFVDNVYVPDSLSGYTFVNITSNHTISVKFAINAYVITATAGLHGSISPSGSVGVNSGDTRAFTFTPASGYHVDSLFVDNIYVPDSLSGYTFVNITANHTISVKFAINAYVITATAELHGSISPSGSVGANSGDTRAFTFTPATGYHVDSAFVDNVYVPDSISGYTFVNITANHMISVKFAINAYIITATAGLHGTISPSGSVGVNSGDTRAFTFTPATGYHVDSLFVDNIYVPDSLSGYTFVNITANHTIIVKFTINAYVITATAGLHGSISPSGTVGVDDGDTRSFAFTPATGYHVDSLFVDNFFVADSTSGYTFVNITVNHTISVKFAINKYTIAAAAGTGGVISPSGTLLVNYGTDTTVSITPNSGYFVADVFVDSISVGKRTGYTFSNVSANHTIEAYFNLNTAPIAPGLFTPADGDTIQLSTLQPPISFAWHSSLDVDVEDTVNYSIHVMGFGLDTTVTGLTDTSVNLNIMSRLQISTTYMWTVNVTDGFFTVASPDTFSFRTSTTITGVAGLPLELPKEYALQQNYPNPFNPEAVIRYQLPVESKVSLTVYNVLGQLVRVLKDGIEPAGYQSVVLNGSDLASGLYFYRLEAVSKSDPGKAFYQVKKMMLMK